MSNTYKDKLKYNIKKYYEDRRHNFWESEQPKPPNYELQHKLGLTNDIIEICKNKFAKGPNRFHHDYTCIPNRRKVKRALDKVKHLADYEDWDPSEIPVDGKPQEWYL